MSELSDLERIRLEKLQKLRERGHEPYPHRIERTHRSQDAIKAFEEGEKEA